ncbi:YveK family protein [Bacillus badius]|uniref:Tyrosine-protein kinase transmembrane modulator EpsC n=1 Tax=Bacillus badius TaxID=1455 RepID=A0ABR5ARD2_BACBA|nr:hypothetical protein [Bacillus badius]KIL77234.1 Tyrosine-protein kinase transmembrane modulator EpsC [Bacillus badius]MED4717597.1 hypothetical protein [Bacillus badius]
MQRDMTIKDFLQLMRKRALLVSMTAMLAVIITAVANLYIMKPMYEASEYLLIGNLQHTNMEASYEETQKIPQMLASSVDFIKSPIVLDAVEEKLDLKASSLKEKLFIENNKDSQIITITIKAQDQKLAKKIAKTTAMISIEKMNALLKFNQVKILEKHNGINEKNNMGAVLVIALMAGIGFGIALAVICEQLDDSIKREHVAEELLGAAVLGTFNRKAELLPNRQEQRFQRGRTEERREPHADEKQVDKATSLS